MRKCCIRRVKLDDQCRRHGRQKRHRAENGTERGRPLRPPECGVVTRGATAVVSVGQQPLSEVNDHMRCEPARPNVHP